MLQVRVRSFVRTHREEEMGMQEKPDFISLSNMQDFKSRSISLLSLSCGAASSFLLSLEGESPPFTTETGHGPVKERNPHYVRIRAYTLGRCSTLQVRARSFCEGAQRKGRRMGGAKRGPSPYRKMMGCAPLYPSYSLEGESPPRSGIGFGAQKLAFKGMIAPVF